MFSHQISGCLKERLILDNLTTFSNFLKASLMGADAERQENEEDVGFNERKSCVEFKVREFLEIGKGTVEGKEKISLSRLMLKTTLEELCFPRQAKMSSSPQRKECFFSGKEPRFCTKCSCFRTKSCKMNYLNLDYQLLP